MVVSLAVALIMVVLAALVALGWLWRGLAVLQVERADLDRQRAEAARDAAQQQASASDLMEELAHLLERERVRAATVQHERHVEQAVAMKRLADAVKILVSAQHEDFDRLQRELRCVARALGNLASVSSSVLSVRSEPEPEEPVQSFRRTHGAPVPESVAATVADQHARDAQDEDTVVFGPASALRPGGPVSRTMPSAPEQEPTAPISLELNFDGVPRPAT